MQITCSYCQHYKKALFIYFCGNINTAKTFCKAPRLHGQGWQCNHEFNRQTILLSPFKNDLFMVINHRPELYVPMTETWRTTNGGPTPQFLIDLTLWPDHNNPKQMAMNTVSQITWLSGLPETPEHLQFPGSSFPGGARNRIVQLHFPSECRLNPSEGIPYKLIFTAWQ